MSQFTIVVLMLFGLGFLAGCVGYPRLINYPVDNNGRGVNSPGADVNPQMAGRYVVFSSDRLGSPDIYMFDTVTRNLVNLPGLNSLDTITSHPSVSENGRHIVFAASRQGRSDIFLYDRETRQSRKLTANLSAEVRNPTITADGTRIAFEYSNNGQWDILVYQLSGERLNIPQTPPEP